MAIHLAIACLLRNHGQREWWLRHVALSQISCHIYHAIYPPEYAPRFSRGGIAGTVCLARAVDLRVIALSTSPSLYLTFRTQLTSHRYHHPFSPSPSRPKSSDHGRRKFSVHHLKVCKVFRARSVSLIFSFSLFCVLMFPYCIDHFVVPYISFLLAGVRVGANASALS